MKVLHLISNHKLTGPVDPAIRLARALLELGVDSRVAVGRPVAGGGPIDGLVRERGLEPITELRLPKHRRLLVNRADARRIGRILEADPVDILHAHLDNAHGIALRARRVLQRGLNLPAEVRRPLVVRSLYDDRAPPSTLRYRWLYGKEADGLFVFGEKVRRDMVARFGFAEDRVVKLDGAVSSERFRPREPGGSLRARFGIPEGAVVAGIVARIQRHRRFEVLLEAVRLAMARVPNLYFLVLGRGTHARELAHDRVRRLGIEDRVRLPGYVGGEDYPAALACFDLKVFLVPGTDGTCRAVREAMATGIPVVASPRGLLPEIVRDGVDGLIVDDEPEPLARAMARLALDPALRRSLGENALARARGDFSLKRQAGAVLEACGRWLDSK
ncbi:MAG TPA: glycosyltransferase family 4 protein [Planctomycetota bacterium]|nr:glycosyltransferase family 4 protein [Planctomycetota bacterium]